MLSLLLQKLAARGVHAKTVCGDVTRLDLGTRFALIFIAFHSLEELASDADRHACLENVVRHLRRDGRFVCTTHDVPSRLATVGPGKGGRWGFMDPRTKRELRISRGGHAGVDLLRVSFAIAQIADAVLTMRSHARAAVIS